MVQWLMVQWLGSSSDEEIDTHFGATAVKPPICNPYRNTPRDHALIATLFLRAVVGLHFGILVVCYVYI